MPNDKSDAIIITYDIGRKPLPDILSDYRQWRSMQEDRIGTHSDDCHMWQRHERCMIHRLADALEKERQVSSQQNLTISEAEREAVERAADLIDAKTCGDSATLRGLLDRLDPDCTEPAGNCHVMTGPEREAIQYFAQWGTWTAASVHAKALEAYNERTK